MVIAVLNGIEISHKLFTPEMVPDQRSYTWLWLCTGYAAIGYPVQLWTTSRSRFKIGILPGMVSEDTQLVTVVHQHLELLLAR